MTIVFVCTFALEKGLFMAKKKAFALRIEQELLEQIEKWAADEFRSTNGQIEWIINEALKKAKRKKPIKKTES